MSRIWRSICLGVVRRSRRVWSSIVAVVALHSVSHSPPIVAPVGGGFPSRRAFRKVDVMIRSFSSPLRYAALAVLIALPLAVPASAQDLLDLATPKAPPPPEVAAFVKRLAGCNHWAGEEATDPERGEQIAQARFRLRCNTVAQDESRLRARFAKFPAALEALDNAGSSED
jgi:hypothetical protein